jgi:DNA-binding transcriptional ArsR family regulator
MGHSARARAVISRRVLIVVSRATASSDSHSGVLTARTESWSLPRSSAPADVSRTVALPPSPAASRPAETSESDRFPAAHRSSPSLESEFLLALRRAGAVMQLLGAASAERIGINVTDLNCLNILAPTGRMTAGELARATGLTTASITGVLDRLEEAGFVNRERDRRDRRRVVIALNAERGLRDVAPVFAPVIEAWRTTAAQYTDEQLTLILGFQRQLEQLMRDRLIELRDAQDQTPR